LIHSHIYITKPNRRSKGKSTKTKARGNAMKQDQPKAARQKQTQRASAQSTKASHQCGTPKATYQGKHHGQETRTCTRPQETRTCTRPQETKTCTRRQIAGTLETTEEPGITVQPTQTAASLPQLQAACSCGRQGPTAETQPRPRTRRGKTTPRRQQAATRDGHIHTCNPI
jgi:hypothetical protein